jgi:hypothetical protein
VVELVDHDEIEGVARETLQVRGAAECLDGGEHDIRVKGTLIARIEAECCMRSNAPKRRQRLP